ncbi:hypothetical protein GSI_00470 [Ganoderma sinense ZZ0214-1]|uniref:Uncharacterized protein n=1 Tax=Ganoderma sinense ZZ0214-1 TaxID=1077348 RepID=A0A2G8SSP4_9APHY|nr:hypothetical protein GSI_00470 [Ganoderma sinense ZZ0214-1]
MRIYSSEASDEPCTRRGWAVDSSTCVLETSFLAKRHGRDETQSSRAPAPASLPSANANATPLPLPLPLSLLPASSAAPGLASSDSFAIPLPTSDAGSPPSTQMHAIRTHSARAPSTSDPFVASRRSSGSRSHARPPLALPARVPEVLCPTTAAPALRAPFEASTPPPRPAQCEGPPSPSSAYYVRPHHPRRVVDSGLPPGMLEQFERVMQELQREGFGGNPDWEPGRSAPSDDDSEESDNDIASGVEPPSPSPMPGHGHLLHSNAELKLKLTPLSMARGSPFPGSMAYCSYSQSQLAGTISVSVSDADIDTVAELAYAHGRDSESSRLDATASAPLLCSLGPGLGSDDGYGAHTHTPNVTEAVDTQHTSDGVRFWQSRFSLHAAGGSSSGSSSGSAAASGAGASEGSRLQPSSTFATMRRGFVALLSDQADEEEVQAEQLRAIADRLEKRARSKRHLVDAIA